MDDAKIGHDIRERAYELMNGKRGLVPSDADLGRAAREVLAKPVATRQAVRAEVARFCEKWTRDDSHSDEMKTDLGMHLLSHFAPPAPPKMMIETMSMEDIAAEFRNSWLSPDRPATDQWYSQHVARVAHRLANTPAPEADPDAGAKRICGKWQRARGVWSDDASDQEIWDREDENDRNGWRAVAAAKKEAGGE